VAEKKKREKEVRGGKLLGGKKKKRKIFSGKQTLGREAVEGRRVQSV